MPKPLSQFSKTELRKTGLLPERMGNARRRTSQISESSGDDGEESILSWREPARVVDILPRTKKSPVR